MHRAVHFWPSFLTRVMRNAPVTGPRRWAPHLLVCTENLDSHVLVMQSTENSMRPDATDPLNRAREWRVFVQRSVRFSNRCNSGHKLAESRVGARRPRRSHGRGTRVGSIQSVFRRSRSAKANRDLACDPVRRRMRCDVDPDELSAGQSHDDEGIEQAEAKGWGNE